MLIYRLGLVKISAGLLLLIGVILVCKPPFIFHEDGAQVLHRECWTQSRTWNHFLLPSTLTTRSTIWAWSWRWPAACPGVQWTCWWPGSYSHWTKNDHLWIIIENAQSIIHLPQKGSNWALWDPLGPFLDGSPRILGFFIIHHLFWWPLVPPRQLLSAF